MVRRTAAQAQARGLRNVSVRIGDAEEPDVAPGSLDAVLASLVIFFLPEPARVLRTYRELLKPAGRVGLTTFGNADDERWEPVNAILKRYIPADPDGNSLPPRRAARRSA
jgi:SAM-dependent methyltransferase